MRFMRTGLLVSALVTQVALAQDAGGVAMMMGIDASVPINDANNPPAVVPKTREYSRDGEISPGTQAPSPDAMVAAIMGGSAEKMRATLEYGERVLCLACVPLLEDKLLSSGNARVREMSAWWLRRQPFAGPSVFKSMKDTVATDSDATRRARAAEALGEFMDPFGVTVLATAAHGDADATVRSAAVRALARLNHPGSGQPIASALSDGDGSVRAAALDSLLAVAGYGDFASVLPLLADPDPAIRTHAARICGEVRYAGAATMLAALLGSDSAAAVRKTAAWALGRIGGASAASALQTQQAKETDSLVLGAIDIAQKMSTHAP